MPDIFVAPKKRKAHHHIFTTFVENPHDISFKGQNKTEEVTLLLRKHFITNFGWLLISFILITLPVFGLPFIANLLPVTLPLNFVLMITFFWYLGTFGFIIINFLFWFYNVNIVSTERIVDIDFIYLLYYEISSTVIEKIEDITYKRSGFFGAFFDYGNVYIQTAGAIPSIEFISIPKPSLVVKIITKLIQENN